MIASSQGKLVFFFQGFHIPRNPFPRKGFWLKDRAFLRLPADLPSATLCVETFATENFEWNLGIELFWNGKKLGVVKPSVSGFRKDSFDLMTKHHQNGNSQLLQLRLRGASFTNFLAWVSRITSNFLFLKFVSAPLSIYRKQDRNQHLQVRRIAMGENDLLNFDYPENPYLPDWGNENWTVGINIIGFFHQEFGLGESARLSTAIVRRCGIRHSLIQAPCNGKLLYLNNEFSDLLQESNPESTNLFHINPDGMQRVFKSFKSSFFFGKYNIGYWHWELPSFPQQWLQHFVGLQEIWVPSHYVFEAIHLISPVPVHILPHAIECPSRPQVDRKKFGLPDNKFIFLSMFDLNSTRIRKNPDASLEAFKRLQKKRSNCHLVVKIHNTYDYPDDFTALKAKCMELENVTLLTQTSTKPKSMPCRTVVTHLSPSIAPKGSD